MTRTWPTIALGLSLVSLSARAQDIGHKIPGTLGLDAGVKPRAGISLVDMFVAYGANSAVDRHGNAIPLGLDLDALAGMLAASVTVDLFRLPISYTASLGVPMAHVHASTTRPEASLDRFGLGDVFAQPIKLGFRMWRVDIVAGYAFYAPTGRFEQQGGIGRGHWTHQVSLGGAVYFDGARTWSLSALASHDTNTKKRDVDITRGDTIQIQGGLGKTLFQIFRIGVAGYWLEQTTDDAGSNLPAVFRGARDRVFGLGPELDVAIPQMKGRIVARYEHDFGVLSRPEGQIFTLTFGTAVWPLE